MLSTFVVSVVLPLDIFGQISVSISAMQLSRCRSNLALEPASVSVGTLGSGGGSGVAKYRATSRAQSVYPDRYLSIAGLSKFRCRWKCLTVSSRMSAFSSLECLVWPSPDLVFTVDSSIKALRIAKLWLIRALLRFSMSGLLVRFRGSWDMMRPAAVFPFCRWASNFDDKAVALSSIEIQKNVNKEYRIYILEILTTSVFMPLVVFIFLCSHCTVASDKDKIKVLILLERASVHVGRHIHSLLMCLLRGIVIERVWNQRRNDGC